MQDRQADPPSPKQGHLLDGGTRLLPPSREASCVQSFPHHRSHCADCTNRLPGTPSSAHSTETHNVCAKHPQSTCAPGHATTATHTRHEMASSVEAMEGQRTTPLSLPCAAPLAARPLQQQPPPPRPPPRSTAPRPAQHSKAHRSAACVLIQPDSVHCMLAFGTCEHQDVCSRSPAGNSQGLAQPSIHFHPLGPIAMLLSSTAHLCHKERLHAGPPGRGLSEAALRRCQLAGRAQQAQHCQVERLDLQCARAWWRSYWQAVPFNKERCGCGGLRPTGSTEVKTLSGWQSDLHNHKIKLKVKLGVHWQHRGEYSAPAGSPTSTIIKSN